MAMLPEINVLAHPTATAPRFEALPAQDPALAQDPVPASCPVGRARRLPPTHFTPTVAPTQPNFVLRRLGVVVAVVATTVVSVLGVSSAGAQRSSAVAASTVAEAADQDNAVQDSADQDSAGQNSAVAGTADATVVIVQPGDTLWTIAERVAPTVDRRQAVDELAKIAGGSFLEVGQRLEIPAIIG